ncbi:DUF998 domain-containing protein [Galactobacter caseinivorans]|uniref:DUF998 domain-containing protein n=1 Tax=Galactobacter caseinivorans TaxID=2676123 RepID=A0A496PIX5_9MICC|nr:DUF998 domain-containing protein [Galactobacter caseinivorans]RKW70419.1 DUF998 domain-containing protein [Galactobacter caseinivorans]
MTDSVRPCPATVSSVGLVWCVAPAWYLLCEAIAASAFRGYNYATFYISDLGVPSFGVFEGRELASQLPQVMDAGFIGAGLLFLVGLSRLFPVLEPGAPRVLLTVFGVLHSVGIALVGLVPGSPENAANGLMTIHLLGAFGAIVGGNLAAIASAWAFRGTALPRSARRLGLILGALGFVSMALWQLHVLLPDGVWERGSVYTFMLWQFVSGVALLRSARALDASRLD